MSTLGHPGTREPKYADPRGTAVNLNPLPRTAFYRGKKVNVLAVNAGTAWVLPEENGWYQSVPESHLTEYPNQRVVELPEGRLRVQLHEGTIVSVEVVK